MKRFKEKVKRKEFELKKQEENEKQRFLNLSDKEKVKRVIIRNFLFCVDSDILFLSFCSTESIGRAESNVERRIYRNVAMLPMRHRYD